MNLSTHFSALALATLIATSSSALQEDSKATSDDPVASAGKMFVQLCIGCHQAPDLRFPTDRAWLNQVSDTA